MGSPRPNASDRMRAYFMKYRWERYGTLYGVQEEDVMTDDIRTAIACYLGPVEPNLDRVPGVDSGWVERWCNQDPECRLPPRAELWEK